MKTVYRAFFVEGGESLITLVGNNVEKHRLSANVQGQLLPSRVWATKIKHCVNIVEAPQANRLIATDTIGRHFGLCSETGTIIWQSIKIGEGDPGTIVKYQTEVSQSKEVFVFATWEGVLQRLDPVDGTDIAEPQDFQHQLRGLQTIPDAKSLFVTSLVPAKSDSDPVGEILNLLDPKTNILREVVPETFSLTIKVSLSGEKALFVYSETGPSGSVHARLERWVIKDLRTGSIVCERTFEPFEALYYKAVWSPDGHHIATASKAGHLLISAGTLETVAMVDGKQAQTPAFHPAGTHICLCRSNNTKIVPVTFLKQHR